MLDRSHDRSHPAQRYRKAERGRLLVLAAGLLVLVLLLALDTTTGAASLRVDEVFLAIFSPKDAPSAHRTIVWTFRMTTALMALAAGASLGVAGGQMQAIFHNPLASPYTLGVSAAAAFGAAIAMVCGQASLSVMGAIGVPACAFVFALIAALAIYGIATWKAGAPEVILLSGVALMFLFNAALAFLQYAASQETLAAIVFWTFGSLQGATWTKLAVAGVVLIFSMLLLARDAWSLTALRLGEDRARGLGVDVRRVRLRTLLTISILTATAVCFNGSIGFIGLVAPHIARAFVGEDQRFFMPLCAIAGAVLLSVASIASKLVIPGAIFPVGIATAFFGVPFFAVLLLSRGGLSR